MRAVVQRVARAGVTVDGRTVARLDEPGLLVLLGVTHGDDEAGAEALARKVTDLRILREERSAAQTGAPLLVVSQFTLYADTSRGRRPSWSAAAPGNVAEPLVDRFVETVRQRGLPVSTGIFGADMAVDLVNDGPVTLIVEV
ncbi:MAG: D-aminoacyl-tRNA deacylase [Actinomycetota bacterium]|nr:D-aminoacyl-tRNA deacylase [Actinomycetota bacterium]